MHIKGKSRYRKVIKIANLFIKLFISHKVPCLLNIKFDFLMSLSRKIFPTFRLGKITRSRFAISYIKHY